MLIVGRILVLVALWFAFESTFSLLATCDHIDQRQADNYNAPKYCTAFNGPAVSVSRLVLRETGDFLKEHEKALLAGFTIVLAISTILLWFSTRGLLKAGERHSERELRAYLQVRDSIGPDLGAGAPFRFEVTIKNSGQTPAYRIRHWTGYTLGPFPLTQPLPPPANPSEVAKTRAIVGGNSAFKTFGEIDQYSAEEIMLIKKEDARLYVFGEITYFDVFGKEWKTEFRLMYGGKIAISERGMLFCEDGNDAT